MDLTTEPANFSDDVFGPLDGLWFAVHQVLCLFILAGNSMTILAICRDYRLQTEGHVYLMHLAIADCLVGVSAFISSFMYLEFSSPAFDENKYLCVSYFSLDYASATQSLQMLTMMAVDRFVNIAYPYHYVRYFTEKVTKRMLSRLTAISAGAFQLFYAEISPEYGCIYFGQQHIILDQFVLPSFILGGMVLTTACYAAVACIARAQRRRVAADEAQYHRYVHGAAASTQLSNRTKKQEPSSSEEEPNSTVTEMRSTDMDQPDQETDHQPRNMQTEPRLSKIRSTTVHTSPKGAATSDLPDLRSNSPAFRPRKQKSLTLFVTVNSIFCLCWLPFVMTSFAENFTDVSEEIVNVAIFLGAANSGMNFVIYALRHKQFARAYRDLLCRCFCPKSSWSPQSSSLS